MLPAEELNEDREGDGGEGDDGFRRFEPRGIRRRFAPVPPRHDAPDADADEICTDTEEDGRGHGVAPAMLPDEVGGEAGEREDDDGAQRMPREVERMRFVFD